SLSAHIGQRIRWARGMSQIFRIDNPLLGRGLQLGQRLCYVNAMLHFFYGLPRLVFMTAPLAYLLFGAQMFQAPGGMVLAYALPHILLSITANSRLQGRFRHSFWNEVYETVLAWYIAWPVLLALINPKLGSFNVTAKGGVIAKGYFDWRMAAPYVLFSASTASVCALVSGTWQWDKAKHPLSQSTWSGVCTTSSSPAPPCMSPMRLGNCDQSHASSQPYRPPSSLPTDAHWFAKRAISPALASA
ncbi:hypothetical protein ACVBEH_12705, partial [Roseateles sp. GG27B]